ncbi:MAG: hypothetical protein JWP59_4082, partial [Massilia sp.]|nr:hypothetical protein [Massilia sp.]
SGETAPAAAAGADAPAAHAPAAASTRDGAGRLAAYQKALLGLAAGGYGGECNNIEGPTPKDGVTVSPAGAASAKGWSADLVGEQARMSLARTVAAGAAPTGSFAASGADKPWQLIVNSGSGGSAMFGDGASAAQCRNVAAAAALAARPLYPAVAQFFVPAGASMQCADGGALRTLAIKPGPSGVAFGERGFAFDSTATQETLAVEPREGSLQYGSAYADGSHVELTVDAAGKLSVATYTLKQGVAMICSVAAKD